jgi:hypothetical protein
VAPFREHLSYSNVVASLALFVALGGGAYAVTSGSFIASDGAINGCVPKKGGSLEVFKASKRCPKGLVSVTFDAKGQPGAQGSQGPQGGEGPQGGQGPPGPNGLNGAPVIDRASFSGAYLSGVNNESGSPESMTANGTFSNTTADEDDLLSVQITYTPPATCSAGGNYFDVSVLVDGRNTGLGEVLYFTPGGSAETFSDPKPVVLFPPGAGAHTISFKASDACTGAGEALTVNALNVDVVGLL